jgi:hypothetical protein
MARRKQAFGVVLCMAVLDCAGSTTSSPGVGAVGPSTRDSITLMVDNQDFYDANVYYRLSGSSRRLGTISGKSTSTFRIRWEPATLYVMVDFIGAGSLQTDGLSVNPQEYVEIRIPPDAHLTGDRLRRVR